MKEHNDSKVPTIRFKGFEGEWVEKMLGDVCAIGDADHWMPETTSHGIPYVMTGDFCGINEIDFKNAKLISLVDFKKLSKRIKPEFGDILFARYASIGSVRYVNTTREFIASYSCAIVKSNSSFNSEYLFYLIQTDKVQNQLKQSINTGSQGNIGIESLKTLATPFPERTEQDKSAKFFSRINEMLRLHQSKHDKLVTLKKAMLKKMFPQAGATAPEIRFKGFEGAWVEQKLGELCDEFHSGKFISASEITETGEYPVLGGNGIRGFTARFNHDGLYALIGRQGALCGNVNLFSGRAFFTEHAVAVQANKDNDTGFLYYLFGKMDLGQYSSQSAQPGLAVNRLQELRSPVCMKSEQIQIGTYFRKLDELISKHAIQLQKLKQFKSACLEKMFV